MVLVNTFFTKKEGYLNTYKSEGFSSQTDFMMVRKHEQMKMMNCKVISREPVVAQQTTLYKI